MSTSRKLQLFELDKSLFYNQANWIEEYEYDKGLYITITMEVTLMKRVAKATATLIPKVTVILIAKVTGTAKIM